MAITYGFYNSLNQDRRYNAEQMSAIFDGIITDGVFENIGGKLFTIAGEGMQVIVKTGKAWFNSTWTLNDAQLALPIDASDVSLTRIDTVILEVNSSISVRENTIRILKGTPSANPVAATLADDEDLHQHALAYINVAAGATSITASNITINVGQSSCPFITSVLQQTSIVGLFNAWDEEFQQWFANIKSQLEGDVATNLQRQIDTKVNISDKATEEDINSGTLNKWVSSDILPGILEPDIGTIVLSAVDISGDKYHVCDGGPIDANLYPELTEKIGGRFGVSGYDSSEHQIGDKMSVSGSSDNSRGYEYFTTAAANSKGSVIAIHTPYIKSSQYAVVSIHDASGSLTNSWNVGPWTDDMDSVGCSWIDDSTPCVACMGGVTTKYLSVYIGSNVNTPTWTSQQFASWNYKSFDMFPYKDCVYMTLIAPSGTARLWKITKTGVTLITTYSLSNFRALFIMGDKLYGTRSSGCWYIDLTRTDYTMQTDSDDPILVLLNKIFPTGIGANIAHVSYAYRRTMKENIAYIANDTYGWLISNRNGLSISCTASMSQMPIGPMFVGDTIVSFSSNDGKTVMRTLINGHESTYTFSHSNSVYANTAIWYSTYYGDFKYGISGLCYGVESSAPGAIIVSKKLPYLFPLDNAMANGRVSYIKVK